MPSTPAAPLFLTTRSYASHRLPRSHTTSMSPLLPDLSAFVRSTSTDSTSTRRPAPSGYRPDSSPCAPSDRRASVFIGFIASHVRLLAFFPVRPFATITAATMASADFLTRIPTPHAVSSTKAPVRISPGRTHPPSRVYLSDLHHSVPCTFRALTICAALPRCNASYPLPVRQARDLPSASSRFAVTHNTLAVQLTLPLAGRVEDFHLQVSAPCRAHAKKSLLNAGVFYSCCYQTASRLRGHFSASYYYDARPGFSPPLQNSSRADAVW